MTSHDPTVPFLDLRRTIEPLRRDVEAAIARVLASGWFLLGAETAAFEQEFARACGAGHAVAVASGTDALEIALRALHLPPGSEVVTQSNTCVPTVAAIERAGAVPVLCDADPASALMDPGSLAAAIGPRTRCVIPVHLYGQCADVEPILAIAERNSLAVIEDCAQAHGAKWMGRHAGTFGIMGCFSFYPTKNLGALGDGGMVVTNDPGLADGLRCLRQYGEDGRYNNVDRGINSRLDELQAAVLRVRLPRLAESVERRRAIAAVYDAALESSPTKPLESRRGAEHAYHLYVVQAQARDAYRGRLAELGVSTMVHYPRAIHAQPAYRALGDGPVPLTAAEHLAEAVVSLPLYPELSDEEVAHVAWAAREAALAQP